MVLRSITVLGSAVLVATSPTWLQMLASWLRLPAESAQALPFSPYWVAIPAALAMGVSWVYEMGTANGSGLDQVVAAGGFNLGRKSGDAAEADRRADRAARDQSGSVPARTSVWKRLETDFREILQFGADLDATWERTSGYKEANESWRLSGVYEEQRIAKKFSELAETAGRMLVEWPGYTPPLSAFTLRQTSSRDRWLCALRDREIKTETWAPAPISQNDAVTGHVHGGAIRDVIEASIELCVQLTLEESLEDREGDQETSLGSRLILPEKVS